MRFMMLVIPKGYEKAAPGTMPDAKLVEAMTKYNQELTKAGVLLALDGLHPPSMGARVAFSGGKAKVTDGPFTEAKEVLGGYWMVITRLIDAPRELVFAAWTDPQHIGQWWGPNGFATTTFEMDVRPGGVWRFVMHGPDGVDYKNRITYLEIAKPERLVYDHDGDEEDETAHFRTTVTFVAQGNKTKLTMRALFESSAERDRVVREYGAIEGGNQTLQRLEQYLTKEAR